MPAKKKELVVRELIDQNDNYEMHVVRLPDMDVDTYGVIHKKWGVLEMSTSVLANARKFLTMLDNWEKNPGEDSGVEGVLPDLPFGAN